MIKNSLLQRRDNAVYELYAHSENRDNYRSLQRRENAAYELNARSDLI